MNLRTVAFLTLSLPAFLFAFACGGGSSPGTSPDSGMNPHPDAAGGDDAGGTQDTGMPQPDAPQDASPDVPQKPLSSALLLFAGDGPQFFDDTWEWDGNTWLARNPATSPPARYDHAMAALNGKIVLFGGSGISGYLGDTWEWDGATWAQKNVPGPSARAMHRMATVGSKIVLFGGSAGGADLCDTWEWDGTTWTQKSATLTIGLHCIGHAIAALAGKVYLFGGVGAESDTWAYDGTSWTKVSTTGPVGRAFTSMTTLGDRIVMFGGEEDANHVLADTWEWDGTTWTQRMVQGPPPRWHAGLAPLAGKLLLFGGDGGSGTGWMGDTWLWDGSAWTQQNGAAPSARYVYTLAAR